MARANHTLAANSAYAPMCNHKTHAYAGLCVMLGGTDANTGNKEK